MFKPRPSPGHNFYVVWRGPLKSPPSRIVQSGSDLNRPCGGKIGSDLNGPCGGRIRNDLNGPCGGKIRSDLNRLCRGVGRFGNPLRIPTCLFWSNTPIPFCKNTERRTRQYVNNSRNLPTSRTQRMHGRNIPFEGTPHSDIYIYMDILSKDFYEFVRFL